MARLFRRILVPHDFSRHATRALRFAARLAVGGGRVHVLHAIAPFAPVTAHIVASRTWIPEGEVLADAGRRLEALIDRTLPARSRPPVEVEVVIGDPMQCILAAARRADLIVMSTAGRTGLPHLVIGSVAEKVVRHAPIPVLTLRPGAARRTGRGRAA
jgi:nucleotide-binding universal stress UspA family protein